MFYSAKVIALLMQLRGSCGIKMNPFISCVLVGINANSTVIKLCSKIKEMCHRFEKFGVVR